MEWLNEPFDIKYYQGFVYKIQHKTSGKYYIGKKFFWSKKVRPPLKGKKNKRHYVIESNWRDYWGSSNKFLAYVKQEGEDKFDRWILNSCDTKFDCAYTELLYQLEHDVLNDPKSFNEIINVRLRKRK